MGNEVLNIFLHNNSFKKSNEKVMKKVLDDKTIFRTQGHFTPKLNTFNLYIGNEILNIFSFNNFFDKSNIFCEKKNKKKIFGHMTIF